VHNDNALHYVYTQLLRGLEGQILASASVSVFKLWPRSGLGLQQMNQQASRDGPVCLSTGRHTMLRVNGQMSQREWEIKVYLCCFDHDYINSTVSCQSSFCYFFFITLFLATAWPGPREIGLGLGLSLIALASASISRFWPHLTSL